MKRSALLFLAASFLAASAQARIGETIAQIQNRFGAGIVVKQEGAGSVRFRYRLRDLKIDVQFNDGRCVWELFHADAPITKEHVHFILDVNGKDHGWNFNPNETSWTRDDGRIKVTHFEGRANELFVAKTY
jgi:hypothetical protein